MRYRFEFSKFTLDRNVKCRWLIILRKSSQYRVLETSQVEPNNDQPAVPLSSAAESAAAVCDSVFSACFSQLHFEISRQNCGRMRYRFHCINRIQIETYINAIQLYATLRNKTTNGHRALPLRLSQNVFEK